MTHGDISTFTSFTWFPEIDRKSINILIAYNGDMSSFKHGIAIYFMLTWMLTAFRVTAEENDTYNTCIINFMSVYCFRCILIYTNVIASEDVPKSNINLREMLLDQAL